MIGKIFSRLTVLALSHSDKNWNKYWVCSCTCGVKPVVMGSRLNNGRTKSCGCLRREHSRKRGETDKGFSKAYTKISYKSMVARCHNVKHPTYIKYGNKGIVVCDRWRFGENSKTGWLCFLEDMGGRPLKHTIDRIDNSKGYEPQNCRWATPTQQNNNKKKSRQPSWVFY